MSVSLRQGKKCATTIKTADLPGARPRAMI